MHCVFADDALLARLKTAPTVFVGVYARLSPAHMEMKMPP